jgi:hypothetical protein
MGEEQSGDEQESGQGIGREERAVHVGQARGGELVEDQRGHGDIVEIIVERPVRLGREHADSSAEPAQAHDAEGDEHDGGHQSERNTINCAESTRRIMTRG